MPAADYTPRLLDVTRLRGRVEGIAPALSARVVKAASEASGPFLRDPLPSRFRQSFEGRGDGRSLRVVNTAARRGRRYAGYVRLARRYDPARTLHLQDIAAELRPLILSWVRADIRREVVFAFDSRA